LFKVIWDKVANCRAITSAKYYNYNQFHFIDWSTHVITVEISGHTSHDETATTLLITYGNKEARVLLQGLAPPSEEPRQEICRRAMLELIQALSIWNNRAHQ
jgi:hypothetical protein